MPQTYNALEQQRNALIAERRELKAKIERLSSVLLAAGFTPCDNPICNCGSWHHRYGLPERWAEIKELVAEAGHPLTNENGHLLRNAVAALIRERDRAALRQEDDDG